MNELHPVTRLELLDLTPDAVFFHKLDGRFLYVNEAAVAMLGYSLDELLFMYPWDFVVNDSRDEIVALWKSMVSGTPVLVEGIFRRKDGTTLPAEVRLARSQSCGGDSIVAYCRDISGKRKTEDALRYEERSRIARDIHDSLAHNLTAIAVQLEAARHVVGANPGQVAQHIANALGLARESLQEARRSVRALHPAVLDSGDLADAIQQVVSHRSEGRPEKFHFRLHGRPRAMPRDIEGHLLRIAQESLTNTLKHARASNVVVALEFADCEVRLRIEDDGIGFNLQNGQPDGFGLTSMNERAEAMGVRLAIESNDGSGTTVAVTVPASPDHLETQ